MCLKFLIHPETMTFRTYLLSRECRGSGEAWWCLYLALNTRFILTGSFACSVCKFCWWTAGDWLAGKRFSAVGGNKSITSSLETSTLGGFDSSFSVLFANTFSIGLFNVRNIQHSSLGPSQHSCFIPLLVYVTYSDQQAKYVQGSNFS